MTKSGHQQGCRCKRKLFYEAGYNVIIWAILDVGVQQETRLFTATNLLVIILLVLSFPQQED
jgi:hypothetical protein